MVYNPKFLQEVHPMVIRIGINGFGRIGKGIVRAWLQQAKKDLEIVMINDLVDHSILANWLKYDSVHGTLAEEIAIEGDQLKVGPASIKITSSPLPTQIPWHEAQVDVVLECTGFFTDGDKARDHLKQGVWKVIIFAPAKDRK